MTLATSTAAPESAGAATSAPEPVRRRVTARSTGASGARPVASIVGVAIPGAVLLFVLLAALLPAAIAPLDPFASNSEAVLQPPSLAHLFGTDNLGRDLFSRFVHGTATTLLTALVALAIGFLISVVLGLLAGYAGGIVDDVIGRLIDIFLAVPGLLISLMLVTGLGFGSLNVAVAVGVSSIGSLTRVMRAEVLKIRQADFVVAASKFGHRWYGIVVSHVLPHAIRPIAALAILEFGSAILSISALSFLGFGAPPPTPEWGSLVSEGRNYLATAWWLTVMPGLAIVAVVISTSILGKKLERR